MLIAPAQQPLPFSPAPAREPLRANAPGRAPAARGRLPAPPGGRAHPRGRTAATRPRERSLPGRSASAGGGGPRASGGPGRARGGRASAALRPRRTQPGRAESISASERADCSLLFR